MSEAQNKTPGIYVFKEPVVMVWPTLVKAMRFQDKPGAPANFSAQFLLKPNSVDHLALMDLAKKVARASTEAPFADLAFPFKNGDKKADRIKEKSKNETDKGKYYRGSVIFNSSTGEAYPPALSVFSGGKVENGAIDLDDGTDEWKKYTGGDNGRGWFYSGALVLAVVNLKFYKAISENAKAGVKAYLANVVSTGKGDRLSGGGQKGTTYFGAHVGHTTQEDPTVGQDEDDIAY